MEILCFTFRPLCRADGCVRQGRGKRDNSDLATAIRTSVILFITWGIVFAGNHTAEVKGISGHTWIFLILSGAATGLSWLFYFKALQVGDVSRVAPIDKLSVVITICLSFLFLKEPGQPAGYHRGIAHYGW